MADRIYFGSEDGSNFTPFDFGGNQSGTVRNISSVVTSVKGAFARDNIVAVLDNRTVRFWDAQWDRRANSDFDLDATTGVYGGLGITATRILALHTTSNRIEFYTHAGVYQSTEDITLPSASWTGLTVTDDRILVTRYVDDSNTYIDFYTHAGAEQTSEQIEVDPDGIYHALGITDTRFYIVHTNNRRAYAYDFSRTRQSTDDITGLPTNVRASLTLFEPSSATLTLTTADTDRRGGVAFTVDIDADIDISDFVIGDIDVTNGTASNFVETDAQNFSVDITPDSGSGTVTVAIAEDAVSPGNAAVSEDFTITANYQLHIADGSNDNISVIGYDTADGDTADALRTYTTTDSTDVQSIVYDGTHIHVTNWQQSTVRVYAVNLSGVSPVVRSYTVTGISQPSGMAFDGTHIHIADRASDNIRVIAPDTADNGTATILRTYEVTGLGDCRGMAFDGENIHAADYTDDNIRVFAPDTPDNGTATVIRTYTVRDVNHSRSIAFDGVNIHVSDVTDDNFRVVAVPNSRRRADGVKDV